MSAPVSGDWYIGVRGFASFSGVTLQAAVETGGGNGNVGDVLSNGVVRRISGAKDSERFFRIQVPAGSNRLTLNMSAGTGDADLYVKKGSAPTTSSWDHRPYRVGNNETVIENSPAPGVWYVMVRGWSSFSDVSLAATF